MRVNRKEKYFIELEGRSLNGCVCAKLLQSRLTLCDPLECSPLGSSLHGILQARILEWVAISFSKGSSWSRDQTQVSMCPSLASEFFTTSTTLNGGVASTGASLVIQDKKSTRKAGDAGDLGWIPELGRSPGGGNGNPFQYFCWKNPVNRGAWWATVHVVTKSQTWLSMHEIRQHSFDSG